MMRRPSFALHRSVWFWLGCFVMLFLVWVWVDSMKTMRTVRRDWAIGGSGLGVVALYADRAWVSDGCIRFLWGRPVITDATLKANSFPVAYRRNGASRGETIVKPQVLRSEVESAKGVRMVSYLVVVPMWCVVALWLLVCGGVLVWRRWRWRRASRVLSDEGRGEEGVAA